MTKSFLLNSIPLTSACYVGIGPMSDKSGFSLFLTQRVTPRRANHERLTDKYYAFLLSHALFCSARRRRQKKETDNQQDFSQQIPLANNGTSGIAVAGFLGGAAGTLALRRCTRRELSRPQRRRRRGRQRCGWRRQRVTCYWAPTGPSTSKSATSSTPMSGDQALTPSSVPSCEIRCGVWKFCLLLRN